MPIQECTLPSGGKGWKWGSKGKCFASRSDAEKQAAAAYSHGYTGDRYALDRASVRRRDVDGRMVVEISNISKANICPYLGHEIPGYESLGLDPDKIYHLLRDPEELEKAAGTFNSVPVLMTHQPSVAEDHPREIVVGTTGTDAVFEAPYLKNSLTIWDQEGIDLIESGEQKELSAGYRYIPEMTPGTYENHPYDGVMREIRGNHVALVAAGRAGADVVVGDSKLSEGNTKMKMLSRKAMLVKGALMAMLPTMLAQDQTIDLNKLLEPVKADNYKKLLPSLIASIKPKLAKDADPAHLTKMLEAIGTPKGQDVAEENEEESTTELKKKQEEAHGLTDDEEASYQELKKKRKADPDDETEDERKVRMDARRARDEELAEGEVVKAQGKPDPANKQLKPAGSSPSMGGDTLKLVRAIATAEKEVKPYIGEVAAMDTAEAIYEAALKQLKVDITGVHKSAYRAILLAQPKPAEIVMAADASHKATSVEERFPEAKRIKAA